ncbi:hypothetical protein F183_A24470 [Bryobacterales bacterium F-183]|nr:hypothetical protein F183_A24470 [Bryobacterales bacterium F-183]
MRDILLVIAAVLLLRLPFLNQAVQGDDIYYLAGAQHAQLDPLHPTHAKYVFLGKMVDMRGHPHPPLDAWTLGLLLAIVGDIREVPFHAAYIGFSLIAALSMLSIARRFTDKPLIATFLFLAVPPFIVNGNSFESDIPFLAFWMLAIAGYLAGRTWVAVLGAALASLAAYQAAALIPILFLAPVERRRWTPILTPIATFAAFQLFERFTSGDLPAAVLTGYMQTYGWQRLEAKIRNGAMLTIHLICTLVNPLAWLARRTPVSNTWFLLAWIGIFFAGALAAFFAGSARYLLPIAAPLCILASTSRFAIPAIVLQATIGIGLAIVNAQHWNGIRDFANSLPLEGVRRVFVHGEWGLRFYLEARGAIPLETGQRFRPGDVIVSTAYANPLPPGNRVLLREQQIDSSIPLRIIGLGSQSGFSSVDFGFFPYGVSTVPLDRLRAETVAEFHPTLSNLVLGQSEEVNRHLITGVAANDKWTLQSAAVLLKRPSPGPLKLKVKFYVPEAGINRTVTITADGKPVMTIRLDHDGVYEQTAEVTGSTAEGASIGIDTDKPLQAPGDMRLLGVNLIEIGFVP